MEYLPEPCVGELSVQETRSKFMNDAIFWNTGYYWTSSSPPKFKLLKHEVDFHLLKLEPLFQILQRSVGEGLTASEKMKEICTVSL
jgi:hypothetical protein